jgi:hypothetical protein
MPTSDALHSPLARTTRCTTNLAIHHPPTPFHPILLIPAPSAHPNIPTLRLEPHPPLYFHTTHPSNLRSISTTLQSCMSYPSSLLSSSRSNSTDRPTRSIALPTSALSQTQPMHPHISDSLKHEVLSGFSVREFYDVWWKWDFEEMEKGRRFVGGFDYEFFAVRDVLPGRVV